MYGKPRREASDTKNDVFYQTGGPNMPLLCAKQVIAHYNQLNSANDKASIMDISEKDIGCIRTKLKTRDAKIRSLLDRAELIFVMYTSRNLSMDADSSPALIESVKIFQEMQALKKKYGVFVASKYVPNQDANLTVFSLNGLDGDIDWTAKDYNARKLRDTAGDIIPGLIWRYQITSSPTIIAVLRDTYVSVVITRRYIEGKVLEDALEKAADKIIHDLEWVPSKDFCSRYCD